MCTFTDHGRSGTGEALAMLSRPGNAGANTADGDHQLVLVDALAQLPGDHTYRAERKVRVRADAGGGTHKFVEYLAKRRLGYSIAFVTDRGHR